MTPTLTKTMTPTLTKTMTPTLTKTMTPTKTNTHTHTHTKPNIDTMSNRIQTTISAQMEIPQRSHQGLNTMGGNKNEGFSVDPHQLTGKIGIERMMRFIDSKSPPVKGEYEYKPETIRQYGRIFSSAEIGRYSAKIKTILNNIYNEADDRVSDGIILIYSQYIDSGLIPVALALEEMGFTRYGDKGIKPLFKSRPSPVVDVRTMKPPTNSKDFKPARYSMITGDTRLSPDNDFEVKGLTGEDNKYGDKVKVVLLSKAGSEGIDLKYIRQVHILDPWYNMNRPEQTIGRAVRNFSHKDLPFEERNVEIFMYGTILDKNVEEAADLYVYRVAEFKAVQIGKVTRVLKETAVDCIINHDQTQFTQEIMSASLKQPITQKLSSGKSLPNFKVGDAPFSPACDYMASCNYNCRPNAQIEDLNEDTYDQHFMMMNSEKILQRIRMLFKEGFFYKKDTLMRAIRTPKEYPRVQIYSALTQLIEDDNEFLVDRYGRNGRLVNIGEYYLFQPIELKDKHVSIYDRSVPLDYKHDMIKFELKKEVAKPVSVKPPSLQPHPEKALSIREPQAFSEGKEVLEQMRVNYNITQEYLEQSKVPRGDENWYKHCGIVIQKLIEEYPKSDRSMLSFLAAHMIELLLYREKHELMNYIYSLQTIPDNSLELYVKQYFEQHSITTKKHIAFITYELNKRHILMLNKQNIWVKSTPEDEIEIASDPATASYLSFDIKDYNKLIGFIGYEKGNKGLAFKTKNMESKRDIGARCTSKNKNLVILNEILGGEVYTIQNTKGIVNDELCVMEEFILRYFNSVEENGVKWFMTPELAIWHKLYKVIT
ncbi:MAG: helicase-related protein [Flavobacterium sp.]